MYSSRYKWNKISEAELLYAEETPLVELNITTFQNKITSSVFTVKIFFLRGLNMLLMSSKINLHLLNWTLKSITSFTTFKNNVCHYRYPLPVPSVTSALRTFLNDWVTEPSIQEPDLFKACYQAADCIFKGIFVSSQTGKSVRNDAMLPSRRNQSLNPVFPQTAPVISHSLLYRACGNFGVKVQFGPGQMF